MRTLRIMEVDRDPLRGIIYGLELGKGYISFCSYTDMIETPMDWLMLLFR